MISGFLYTIVGCVIPCTALASVLSMLFAMRHGDRPGKLLMLKMCIVTFFVFHLLLSLSHALAGVYVVSCYVVGIAFFLWQYKEKRKNTIDKP